MITHGKKQISEIVYARKASEGGGAVRLTNIIRGAQVVFGGLAPNVKWLKAATKAAILAAFGKDDGYAVLGATNAYLNALAATDKSKASALAGFINHHPLDAALYGGLYVQDGLVFQMDRAYECTANKWTDFIGGVEFNGTNVQIVDDVPYFNGSAKYNNAQNLPYDASSCTIEVAFTREKTGRANLLDNNSGGKIGFLFYSYYQGIGSNGSSTIRFNARDTLGAFTTVGIAGNLGIQDKVAMTTQGTDFWGASSSGTTIGGGREQWLGKIYGIRIYNRLLTDAEILANQDIDLKRFTTPLNQTP